ncbi:MAG: sel1 repeat family protein [Lentisphaeria bacterium]|nr:sel1 repeat family protein [Lentisphaeria bacterium]
MKCSIITKKVLPAMAAAIVSVMTGCASVEEIQRKADAGDREMQYDMAIRYKEGNGVRLAPAKSEEYLKKSFENGYIPAACAIANEIHGKRNIEASEKLMKCYDIIFGTSPLDIASIIAQKKFGYAFPQMSRSYFLQLVEAKKEKEAVRYKKCVLAYLNQECCPTEANIDTYRQTLIQYVTEEEKRLAEQKRLVEQQQAKSKFQELDQNQQRKYPNSELGKGIKLYKNVYAGSSLEWLRADAAVSNKKIKSISRPMFEDEFLPEIPEIWRGQTFRQNYAVDDDGSSEVSYIFAGSGKEQTMIGCCIILQNVQVKSIVEKYQKEFPGLKIQEKRVPRIRFIAMHSKQVRISVVLMQPGNFVSIFIADPRYIDWYRNMIRKTEEAASKKALDF